MKSGFGYFSGGVSATVVFLAVLAGPARAGDTVYLSDGATHCEIFMGLSREQPKECQKAPGTRGLTFRSTEGRPKTRGIVLHSGPQPQQAQAAAGEQLAEYAGQSEADASAPSAGTAAPSISFKAEFEYDSARLTSGAREVIDRVATVLNHALMQDKVIQIEGHADATGPDGYNLALSERRARAVYEYLVQYHDVDARRLRYVGKGEHEPFDPQNPTSGVNRRVEFKNLSG